MGNLLTDKGRQCHHGVDRGYLYLGKHQRRQVTAKLIDLPTQAILCRDYVAFLADYPTLASAKEFPGIFHRDFILPLAACRSHIGGLDRQEALRVTYAHSHHGGLLAREVSLLDTLDSDRLLSVGVVRDKEFSFNFFSHRQ